MNTKIYIVLVLLISLVNLFSTKICYGQSLLSMPESIIYDINHHRYLISNCGTGDIIQVDSNGIQSYFVQGKNAIQGLEIVGNVVYVGSGFGVRGFNLESGEMVMDVQISGAANINDVTADESGNIYASEVFGTRIFKVKISTQTYSVFVNGQGISNPNGLYFDEKHNRILVCSYRTNSPIQAINISDSTVTILTNTNMSECDGFTMDKYNRYYVTSWTTNSIYRFDSVFSNPPELVYHNNCGAADISYDSVHNVIAMPLQPCNRWGTLQVIPPIGIQKEGENLLPEKNKLFQNYPNPFNPVTRINFDLPKQGLVTLKIYDVLGREVKTLINEVKSPGKYSVDFNATELSSSVYFYKLECNGFTNIKRMLLIK
jgi:hypothetical protein